MASGIQKPSPGLSRPSEGSGQLLAAFGGSVESNQSCR
jgi:hypothetical protein